MFAFYIHSLFIYMLFISGDDLRNRKFFPPVRLTKLRVNFSVTTYFLGIHHMLTAAIFVVDR